MARLNEPPAPTESVESLKRRFLRQNRELAKSNSVQSIRIRSLEAEVAKLISENITLRDRNLQLEGEVSRSTANHVYNNVQGVQSRLEAKVREINDLVIELGTVKDRVSREAPSPSTVNSIRPSASRPWRSSIGSAHMHGALSGSMPAIVEGKQYPRTSLIRDELQVLPVSSSDNSLSPDIGPPPVAHLESEESASSRIHKPQDDTDSVDDTQYFRDIIPTILESRRRKRESINPEDIRRASMFDQSPENNTHNDNSVKEDAPKPPRAGAKRKFDARDFAETTQAAPASTLDDSTFIRKSGALRSQRLSSVVAGNGTARRANEELSTARGKPRERSKDDASRRDHSGRKVLAPKSTNLESSSPVKSNHGATKEKDAATKKGDSMKPTNKDRAANMGRAIANVPSTEPSILKTVEILPEPGDEPPPETPAGLDLFSPLSSQPSTDRRGLQDTPPPPELDPTTSTGDALTGAGRGGRRARGNVSYAEPNLRDKMRRPTKDLVDAVTGEGRNRKSTSNKPDQNRSDSEGPAGSDTVRTVFIQKDDRSEVPWKRLPSLGAREQEYRAGATSPLGGKKASEEEPCLPLTITTDRKRRQSALSNDNNLPNSTESHPSSASASAATISTLIASSKRAKENERRKQAQQQSMDQAMQDLNIYDFEPTSSPPPVESKRPSKEQLARKREERRRNSLVTAASTKGSGRERGSPETDSEISANEGGARARIRRQTLGEAGGKKADPQLVKTATASAINSNPAEEGSRAASRRRSMMI